MRASTVMARSSYREQKSGCRGGGYIVIVDVLALGAYCQDRVGDRDRTFQRRGQRDIVLQRAALKNLRVGGDQGDEAGLSTSRIVPFASVVVLDPTRRGVIGAGDRDGKGLVFEFREVINEGVHGDGLARLTGSKSRDAGVAVTSL